MSTSRYHQANLADVGGSDDDSDDDLTLHELDPATSHEPSRLTPDPNRTQGRPAWGNGGNLGVGIQLKRLRASGSSRERVTRATKEGQSSTPDEDLSVLYDENDDARKSAESNDSAATPLLPTEDDHIPDRAHGALRKNRRTSNLSQFMAKLRSTPRSEVEEEYDPSSNRVVAVGHRQNTRFPPNIVSNAKYTPWSFVPRTLYHEFSFFLNLYFLLVALSQIIPQLRIGYLSTYIAPLAFVIAITLGKEAVDDISRRRRDAEANAERFTVLAFDGQLSKKALKKSRLEQKRNDARGGTPGSARRLSDIEREELQLHGDGAAVPSTSFREVSKMSKDLKVGDILKLSKDQRVPADVVFLQTTAPENSASDTADSGEAFIRTDQLDGETDWKLRIPPALSQPLQIEDFSRLQIHASKPDRKVNEFVGTLSLVGPGPSADKPETPEEPSNLPLSESAGGETNSISLTIDNTAWANTVLASSGTALAAIVYTGPQTRQALSTSSSRTKTGLLEYEINSLTKLLCALTLLLSFLLVALEKFETPDGRKWYIAVMRFLILFSTIVPISLRVNLDLAKSVYAWFIHRDGDIPGTVVRTSTIPEDLGRIEYLLSDKTGTLTQNDMQLRKIHIGTVSYGNDAMTEVTSYVRHGFGGASPEAKGLPSGVPATSTRSRREIGSRVRDVVLALALCHNVTPTTEEQDGEKITTYQASSPDEIAIVRWTEAVGLRLAHRDRQQIVLESSHSGKAVARVDILNVFPFTSDGKRMGIILKFNQLEDSTAADGQCESIWFFQKGADTVMSAIVAANDWLDEETANMAREGLRTLVVGRKRLSLQQYGEFSSKYKEASISLQGRDAAMSRVVKSYLEHNLELLGVTGVEDKLQQDVKPSLELLRNAGVKIWMLTGDKVETARCVAVSSKLVARGQYIHTVTKMSRKDLAQDSINFLRSKTDACLLIDGESLALMLAHHRESFISTAVRLPTVVACRCSPTQKAELASLIRSYTKKRICCIGDGGNDVSMIQAADVGVGIVGKEGRQASLAADFSILQFCYLTKLLMWHGRNSYKRSAKLGQFVMHRGLIISVCQAVFSISSVFEPIALYKDWLLVGYATIYTMAPVFSLVLDRDIPPELAHVYPELYAELSASRSLSYRTFFIWVAISIYQGCAIQLLSQLLVDTSAELPSRMVSVSFTALVINEIIMVAAEVTTWHWVMAATIFGTAAVYFGSFPFLGRYFDLGWLLAAGFWWRLAVIAAVSLVPVYAMKILRRTIKPPSYRKVQHGA